MGVVDRFTLTASHAEGRPANGWGTFPGMDTAGRTSPLHDRHVALGAKLAAFGG